MNRLLLPLLATVLLLTVGCSAGGGREATSGGATGEGESGAMGSAQGGEAGDEAGLGGQAPPDEGGQGAGAGGEGGALPDVTQVLVGERIIKEGTVSLEVGEGEFDVAFQRVVEMAERLGGTVVASTTTNAGNEGPSGSVTVRVPVEEYERLLVGVRQFGTIRARQVTSQDVSTEFVDLEARLRQAQAQERFYLRLLEEAEDVEDAIAVQQQLAGIQTDIERLKGRLQYLESRTTYSTLTVELFEPGAAPRVVADGVEEPTLAEYWATARRGLVRVLGTLLVAGVALLPLTLPVVLALLAWGWWRRQSAVSLPPAE